MKSPLTRQFLFVPDYHYSTSRKNSKKEWVAPLFPKVKFIPAHNSIIYLFTSFAFFTPDQRCKLRHNYIPDNQNVNVIFPFAGLASYKSSGKHYIGNLTYFIFICRDLRSQSGSFGNH